MTLTQSSLKQTANLTERKALQQTVHTDLEKELFELSNKQNRANTGRKALYSSRES